MGLYSSCALSLRLTHDVFQDFDNSDNYGLIFFVRIDDFNAFSNETVLDTNPLTIHVSIEVVVDLNQEFDGLRDDSRILAMQSDVPHDLQLIQVLRWLHKLESRKLGSLCLLLGLDGFHRSIASINVETVSIAAIAGISFLGRSRLALNKLLRVLIN